MTSTAVGMHIERRLTGTVVAVGRGLVLVGVVAEMLRGDALLMLTIGAGRRPDGLERKQKHQENEGKTLHHGPECNRCGVVAQLRSAGQHPDAQNCATLRFMM